MDVRFSGSKAEFIKIHVYFILNEYMLEVTNRKRGNNMANLRLEFIPDQRVAYIRRTGAYGPENYSTMGSLKQWADEKGLLNGSALIYAIIWDNPTITPPDQCRYDACLVVNDDFEIGNEVNEGIFEQGWYAVFEIEHTVQAVQQAWQWIFPKILEAGYRIDETRGVVERYHQELVARDRCELCIPITI